MEKYLYPPHSANVINTGPSDCGENSTPNKLNFNYYQRI